MAKNLQPELHPHPALDRAELPRRHTTVGRERAPHPSYRFAMGVNEKQDI